MSYQIYTAKLKNELTASRKKTQCFSYVIIFFLSSKRSDLRPGSQNTLYVSVFLFKTVCLLLSPRKIFIFLPSEKFTARSHPGKFFEI